MSDTLQHVQWALEWSCALRKGEAVHEIIAAGDAGAAVRRAQFLASAAGRNHIFDGIYVSSEIYATLSLRLDEDGRYDRSYPHSGYFISEQFEDVGGLEGVQKMCEECPANAGQPQAAGCVGDISQDPWCPDTQQFLADAVPQLGLRTAIAEHFPVTTPIWFGLWARPPLSSSAAGVLAQLLAALHHSLDDPSARLQNNREREELESFIKAARIAEAGTARLHVRMPPPGHVDFGFYTVFPHCPVCKAEADVERWQRKYPSENCRCKVCGTDYSPAAQASFQPDGFRPEPELRDLLGDQVFREFAKKYLMANGMPEADAAETVELTEAQNLSQIQQAAQEDLRDAVRDRYIEESLYAGLGFERRVDPTETDNPDARGFAAQNFTELIKRCAERGIEITGMSHHSLNDDFERLILPIGRAADEEFDALKTLQQWRSEGCDELFAGYFKIPEELIEAFEKERAAK